MLSGRQVFTHQGEQSPAKYIENSKVNLAVNRQFKPDYGCGVERIGVTLMKFVIPGSV